MSLILYLLTNIEYPLYIADTLNFRIRKVSASTGTIVSIAGTGAPGISGDGSLASSALIGEVHGLAIDNLYIYLAIPSANKIRRISLDTGIITTFAGNGVSGNGGDGNQGIELHTFYTFFPLFSPSQYIYI
jgi:hypothetical protein